jgi:hypothetical protein
VVADVDLASIWPEIDLFDCQQCPAIKSAVDLGSLAAGLLINGNQISYMPTVYQAQADWVHSDSIHLFHTLK